MKNLRFVLIAAFSLALTATSCKKETTKPATATTPAAPVVIYSSVPIDIALVDRLPAYCAAHYGTVRKAYIVCNSTRIDSLVGLDTTMVTTLVYNECPAPSGTHVNTKSFKVQDGADNYLEIYNDGVKIASSKINMSLNRLEAVYMGGAPTFPDNFSQYPGGCNLLCTPQW